MDGEKKQKQVSAIVFAGGAGVVGGILLTVLSFMLPIPFGTVVGLLLIPVGIVLVVVGLATGWGEAFGDPNKKPVQRASNVYVVAKVVADRHAEPVIDPEFFDPADLRFLVQIEVQGRGKVEFETAPEVFSQIGEGMSGDIVYQGRWLNQFVFRPKQGGREVGEDPFAAGKL